MSGFKREQVLHFELAKQQLAPLSSYPFLQLVQVFASLQVRHPELAGHYEHFKLSK
jgi:hypothetical protein